MLSTRRAFLTSCATVVTTGCVARAGPSPTYQLVAGVEWKTIRGLRDNTIRKIAQNVPVDGPIGDAAPRAVQLQTTSYDDTVVDLAGEGSLVLTDSTIDQIKAAYTDPYAVIVLTMYNEDPYNEIPKGNSYGYRATFEHCNRVHPGDRISATIDRDSDTPAIDDVLTVDAGNTDLRG